MKNSIDDILDLKYHIDKLAPLIEENKKLAAENPDNFAIQLMCQNNSSVFHIKEKQLLELQKQERCDIFEYRLTGDSIGFGEAPMEVVGEFLSSCQKTINRIAQNFKEEFLSANIPKEISQQVSLNIQAFAPGSFKIICNAIRPDMGLFNEQAELAKDNLLFKSSALLFKIMDDINDEDKLLEDMGELHPYTIAAITDLFKVVGKARVNIDASWQGMDCKEERRMNSCSLLRAYKLLNKYDKTPSETEEIYRGNVVAINRKKYLLEFQTTEEILNVHFDDSSCEELRKNDVNPLNEADIYDLKIKTSKYKSLSGKTKTQHLFLSISKVD